MKKIVALMATVALMLVLGGCRGKGETVAISRDEIDDVPIWSDIPSDASSSQSLKLLNSDDVVVIEGITEEEVADIDAVLRHYEKLDEMHEDLEDAGAITWLYRPLRPALSSWFNPEFDLVETVTRELDNNNQALDDSPIAWLAKPLRNYLLDDETQGLFYFVEEQSGCYRMSREYYLLGFVYAYLQSSQTD